MKSEWPHLKGGCQVVSDFGATSRPLTLGRVRLFRQHRHTITRGSLPAFIDRRQHSPVIVIHHLELSTQARRRLASQLVDATPGRGAEKIVRRGDGGTIGSDNPWPHARLESTCA
jgi:hypothetical protein